MGTFSSVLTSYKGSAAPARVPARETEQEAHRQGRVRLELSLPVKAQPPLGPTTFSTPQSPPFYAYGAAGPWAGVPSHHLSTKRVIWDSWEGPGGRLEPTRVSALKSLGSPPAPLTSPVQRRGCGDPGGCSVVRGPSHHILKIWVTNERDRQESLPLRDLTCHARDGK